MWWNRLMGILVTVLLVSDGFCQLKVTSVEKLPIRRGQVWHAPKFSPDARTVYLTNASFDGIWAYFLRTRSLRQVTADPKSGLDFVLSADGRRLAYRRTTYPPNSRDRLQEIIVLDLATSVSKVEGKGETVSTPAFAGSHVVYTEGASLKAPPAALSQAGATVLGIEDTKIALVRNGKKALLDPLGKGSYIWPCLSPDGKKLVAFEMTRGAFVCDVNGNVEAMLGRRNAPVWTRDGRWIVFMRDIDDGHKITSSDIWAISADGALVVGLTDTPGVIELYPECSPTENKVLCSTPDGSIYVLSYMEEVK